MPWIPPEFILALSRTLSFSSDLYSRQCVPEVSSDRHSVAWPCLPRFRIPETPCSSRLRLVVSWSWLVQSPVLLPDVGSALPDFDTCLDSLQYSSCGIGSGIKLLWGVCYCLVSAFPSLPHCLQFRRPVVSNDEDLGVRKVPSPPSLTLRVPPDLPFGLATFGSVAAFLSPVPPDSSTHMMYAAVCGCSSHPAVPVTLRVDGSCCMWPIRSSQGCARRWLA